MSKTATEDYVSTEARRDFQELSDFLFPYAKRLLEQHGSFHPFAAEITVEGEVRPVSGKLKSEQPASDEVVQVIEAGLRRRIDRGQIRAAAICRNARIALRAGYEKKEVIYLTLDHSDSNGIDMVMPYSRNVGGEYEYMKIQAAKGSMELF